VVSFLGSSNKAVVPASKTSPDFENTMSFVGSGTRKRRDANNTQSKIGPARKRRDANNAQSKIGPARKRRDANNAQSKIGPARKRQDANNAQSKIGNRQSKMSVTPPEPPPIKKGDELVLEIADAAFEGRTIGRVDNFVVFVDGGVPGDTAKVRITKAKKSFSEARVVSIEKPSPYRVEPSCKHFGPCGGCKWQHVDYAVQLRFKQQHVVDAFERIGGFSDLKVLPIIGSEEIFYYRNKMEFSFAQNEWLISPPIKTEVDTNSRPETHHSKLFLGLHVPQRYDKVLDITECHLQSPLSNEILNFTRSFALTHGLEVCSPETESGYLRFLVIRQSKRTSELMVNLVTYRDIPDVMSRYTKELQAAIPSVTTVVNTINSKKAQIAFGEQEVVYAGDGTIHEQLGNLRLTISASSFFQTNTEQAERLYSVAKKFASLKDTDVVWDLYSGTGTIALFLSDAVAQVVGVESVESAVRDAERNARLNNISNCTFILGDLKDRLTKDRDWISSHRKPDVLIIDPPRSGMHQKAVEEILELAPDRIVYVSCNPATQARDVKLFSVRYDVLALQPVDMFPHTYHVENVAQLHLRA
jgi:23S rRNA (uracil1939-C5)-methyltransferase